ncbi:MAG TPA: HlyD family efflux transporter periplasmic adaptor subunit [Ramlibacter sp.]|nr:HlyD family efflux transporter periplasmic adaptor subunit [Ramlibacter sp.]
MADAVLHDEAADAAQDGVLALLDLSHRARAASSLDELAFLLVNDTRRLFPYRQAALWFADGGVRSLSGVVQPEANAPYVQWLNRLFGALAGPAAEASGTAAAAEARRVDRAALPADVQSAWAEWLPQEAVWVSLAAGDGHPGNAPGGLLLAGDVYCSDAELSLLGEWLHAWRHAWLARQPRPHWLRTLLRARAASGPRLRWWQRRTTQALALLALAMLFPVRVTVLAPGELVAADPAVIRAPVDGVIGQFHVRPNEAVKAEQLLFTFDEGPLASRLAVANQALGTAEAEYRQFAQQALSDNSSKGQLAALVGKISEKRAEAEFLQSQLERSRVLAPREGVALFDDPSEWVGRPVQTGERVMRLAAPDKMEIEAWIAIGDAIPVADRAPVQLYLAATPFSSISGQVRYIGHDAVARPDGSYAYRLRAALDTPSGQRIGLKGTVKLYGERAPLGYWILRRPLATLRQAVAL